MAQMSKGGCMILYSALKTLGLGCVLAHNSFLILLCFVLKEKKTTNIALRVMSIFISPSHGIENSAAYLISVRRRIFWQ